jgi:hypothetical protein
MSLRAEDDLDELNYEKYNIGLRKYIVSDYEKIDEFQFLNNVFDVYYDKSNNYITLWFISKTFVAARVEFIELNTSGIQVKFSNRFRHFKGLSGAIFIDYLLNHYSKIYSDNVQTVSGFTFYQNLLKQKDFYTNNFEMYFYNNKTNESELIQDPKDMEKTYGDSSKNLDIIYKIVKL